MFKFEGNQNIFIAANGCPVKVIARTEFFTGKPPRYCVEALEGSIPGKNMHQDWINEDQLTATEPAKPEAPVPVPSPSTRGKKSIRTGV